VSVRRPRVDVPAGTSDAQWLATAGAEGWIVLMRDQRVRNRPLEIHALRDAKVGTFVLTAGQAAARDTSMVVIGKLAKMVNIARSELRPFLYTLGVTGALLRLKIR
jgi:hypothetical protein